MTNTELREKLVELLNNHYDCCDIPDCEGNCRECIADYLIANGVTFATDKNDGGKWISVKERLPEDYEKVLTCDHKGNIHVMAHHHDFIAPFGITKHDFRYFPVTHWMPLPSLPEEG